MIKLAITSLKVAGAILIGGFSTEVQRVTHANIFMVLKVALLEILANIYMKSPLKAIEYLIMKWKG